MRNRVTTAALKSMFQQIVSSLALLCTVLTTAGAAPTPADQLKVAGNACGPTALLNAFRFGNKDWLRAEDAISGEGDKQKIYTIIREYGMRPSKHFKGRPRWSSKGVNLADLCDIANEITHGHFLPLVNHQVTFKKPGESQQAHLKRVYQLLETSLKKGLPPLISLRRYVKRSVDGGPATWTILEAHFVTLTVIPTKLGRGVRTFAVSYIDPWGGQICQGQIAISERGILSEEAAQSPCLEAIFPQASVGKNRVRAGEPQALTVAAILGRW
jgi:hypothetical protein